MTTETSEPGILSLEDAAMSLVQMEPQGQPDPDEDDADPAPEMDADAEEIEASDGDDDTTEEADEDDAAEADEDGDLEDVYLIDGEEVTASQLAEWRKNGLFQKDYTKKTQALAEERKAYEADRISWEAQARRKAEELRQKEAQLKVALETFAVQAEQEPDWVQAARTMEPQKFQALQAEWNRKRQQAGQASQAYQALMQKQREDTIAREATALVESRPEWAAPEAWKEASTRMVETASEFGFSPEDVNQIVDHRMYLVLDALAQARAQSAKVDGEKVKATKRVVQAAKRVPAGAKPAKNQAKQKERRAKQDRLKQTGDIRDAVDLILGG